MLSDAPLISPGPVTPATLRDVAARLRERWPTSGRVHSYAGWACADIAQLARLLELTAAELEDWISAAMLQGAATPDIGVYEITGDDDAD